MKIENEQQLAECLEAVEHYLIGSAVSQIKSKTFDIGKSIRTEGGGYKSETLATVKRLKKSDKFDLRIKWSRSIPHEN